MSILANAGTPLIWLSGMHLLFGNFLIGVFEGLLLARIFRLPSKGAVICMIAANYTSFIMGLFLIDLLQPRIQAFFGNVPPIFIVRRMLMVLAIALFTATIVIEWPFCWWLLRKGRRPLVRSLVASLVAQTASYAILSPLYFSVSSMTLLTQSDLQDGMEFVKSPSAIVYYIRPVDGDVWKVRLDGTQHERVLSAGLNGWAARLYVKPSTQAGRFDLWCVPDDVNQPSQRLIAGIAGVARPLPRPDREKEPNTWGNFDYTLPYEPSNDFRQSNERQWTSVAGFWPIEGIQAWRGSKREYRLGLETPFAGRANWAARNVVNLPGDQALFQMGDELMVLDMPSHKIGFL